MAQAGETLHEEIYLQQVFFKIMFVWPSNEKMYANTRTS